MTTEQAIKYIVDNWERLYDKQTKEYNKPNMIAVWVGTSDIAGAYEVDEEWVGITPQGNIAWAYASGCSCWDGGFKEERYASTKELTLQHSKNTPKEWEKAIVEFATNEVIKDM